MRKPTPVAFREYLTDARGKLEALLAFVASVERRHACAMANVYSDDGDKLPPIPEPPEPTLGGRRRSRRRNVSMTLKHLLS
jgi:hypothetical protein